MIYYFYVVKYFVFGFLSSLGVDDCFLYPYTDYCLGCIDCLDAYAIPEQGFIFEPETLENAQE